MDKIIILILSILGIFILIAFVIAIVYFKNSKNRPNINEMLSKDQLLQLNEAYPQNTQISVAPYKVRKQMLPLSLIAQYYLDSTEKVDINSLKCKGLIAKSINKIGIYGSSENIPPLLVETNYIDFYALNCIENANGKVILKKMQ